MSQLSHSSKRINHSPLDVLDLHETRRRRSRINTANVSENDGYDVFSPHRPGLLSSKSREGRGPLGGLGL
jgi:hypothetical protein